MSIQTKTLALTALLALSAPLAHARDHLGLDFNAIIGGNEVQNGDPVLNSTVLIVAKSDEGTSICSGSLIDKDIVLTAAHCVGIDGLAKVVVAFRKSIQSPGPVIAAVDRRRPTDFLDRARFGGDDWHDLALLKLASPAPAGYTPAKLLPSNDMLTTGGSVLLAGYGMILPVTPEDPQQDNGAGTLRKVEQTVKNPALGETEFLVNLTGGKGACHGDSGGPAFVRGANGQLFVAGVASRMTEADRIADNGDVRDFSCSVDMVYTNTLKSMDWIRTAMNQLHGQ